ncbi:MAG: hypothetical protein U5R46_00410 [Gammaproteobacteria bacterium]|nr:hypothetical protein [Gammaproteobacteria bacterium]
MPLMPVSLERRMPLAVFLISLALLLAGAVVRGPFVGQDTDGYLIAGDKILGWLTSGSPSLEKINELFVVPHYLIATFYLYGIHDLLGMGEWGVVVVNSVLFALLVSMLFTLWFSICGLRSIAWTSGALCAGLAGGLYVIFGLPDGFLWSYGVLTDMLFLFWVGAFVYFTTMALFEGRGVMWLAAFLFAVTAPFVRPTGLIVPVLFLVALVIHIVPAIRRYPGTAAVLSLVIPAFIVFAVVPWLVLMEVNPETDARRYVPGFLMGPFLQSVYFFKHGVIVAHRVELDMAGALSYLDILKAIVYRLIYYWVPVRLGGSAYSAIHNIVNVVYMIVALPLLCRGIKCLIEGAAAHRAVLLFLVMVSYGYALQHAVTLVAFDWRYQVPAMVPLWVLVGCGFYDILERTRGCCSGSRGV